VLSTFPPQELKLTFRGSKNVRLAIIDTMDTLQKHLLANLEDDTKSLVTVISIYEYALNYSGIGKAEYDSHWKSYLVVKRVLDHKLIGSRKTIRPMLIDRVALQHDNRLIERSRVAFTSTHASVLANLLKLATSHYSLVRINAQETIKQVTITNAYSYKLLIDPVIALLDNQSSEETVSHEAFKGN
jgi:hypothetical protein